MSKPRLDIAAIGNAIVDILAPAPDQLITELGLVRGGMQLVTEDEATYLYAKMGSAVEASGGSAANTVACMAALACKCGFIGQIANDQFGQIFSHDIRAIGVEFNTPARAAPPSTAQCLIFVSPDGQRTMNTYLGAAQYLDQSALDREMIADAAILYLEGYLWNASESRAAMTEAIAIARAAGREVAFTLSDNFVILSHRDDLIGMMTRGEIDILFANDSEIRTLMETEDLDSALESAAALVPLLIVTRGAMGATSMHGGKRINIPAERDSRVVDTTGAGDSFAAGFLAGYRQQRTLAECLTMGAICAKEVISHYGPRPEANLKRMVTDRLGG